jgi:hypothetical protein
MNGRLPESTRLALDNLMQCASKDKVSVAGFALCLDPISIAAFGNVPDHADIKFYEMACSLVQEKKKRGLVINETVQEPV